MSSVIRVGARGEVGKVARACLAAIDRVHGIRIDRKIEIPVVAGGSARSPAGYEYRRHGEPVRIELSVHSDAPYIDFTHEVGHFLDHQLLGSPGEYTSPSAGGILAAWWEAAESSRAYRRLADLAWIEKARVRQPDGRYRFVGIDRRYARYLLRVPEVFARSYSQFIAAESRDPALLSDLGYLRSRGSGIYPEQWEDADFEPIRAALREVMMKEEWLK